MNQTKSIVVVGDKERLEDQIRSLLRKEDHNIRILQVVSLSPYRSDTTNKAREIVPGQFCREVIYKELPTETEVEKEED